MLHFHKLAQYYAAFSCCTVMRINACLCAPPLACIHSRTYSNSLSLTLVHTHIHSNTPAFAPVHTRVHSLTPVESMCREWVSALVNECASLCVEDSVVVLSFSACCRLSRSASESPEGYPSASQPGLTEPSPFSRFAEKKRQHAEKRTKTLRSIIRRSNTVKGTPSLLIFSPLKALVVMPGCR